MKLKYQDGKISVCVHDFLLELDDQSKIDFIEELSCEDAVIKHVTDLILDRWTQGCSQGASCYPAESAPRLSLDIAWRQVAKRSGEVAAKEIKRLEESVEYWKKQYEKACEENYRLVANNAHRN